MINRPETTSLSPAVDNPQISLTTLVLASSVSLGSNLLEVKKGRMELELAVSNALIKGTLSSAVVTGIRPTTPLRVAGCACLLGSVGYAVDLLMKNKPQTT